MSSKEFWSIFGDMIAWFTAEFSIKLFLRMATESARFQIPSKTSDVTNFEFLACLIKSQSYPSLAQLITQKKKTSIIFLDSIPSVCFCHSN